MSRDEPGDARRASPAFPRNIGPITDALRPLLDGAAGRALEIGCGPGEHAVSLARAFPTLHWLPTDPDPEAIASTAAWRAAEGPANLAAPRRLDAAADWAPAVAEAGPFAVVLAVNVIHIAPWAVAEGLVAGAAAVLAPGGALALYGPFLTDEPPTAPSNLAFDRGLRARDPEWGVRPLAAVNALARAVGLEGPAVMRLPAENLLVAWRAPGLTPR